MRAAEGGGSIEHGATHKQLHLRHFLVHLLHKGNNELNKLVLEEMLCVIVRNQEADVVSLEKSQLLALVRKTR